MKDRQTDIQTVVIKPAQECSVGQTSINMQVMLVLCMGGATAMCRPVVAYCPLHSTGLHYVEVTVGILWPPYRHPNIQGTFEDEMAKAFFLSN